MLSINKLNRLVEQVMNGYSVVVSNIKDANDIKDEVDAVYGLYVMIERTAEGIQVSLDEE